jgi:hypothetical protein
MGKESAFRRWAEKQDRDPSKWPVAGSVRAYMVDCEWCGSRMPLSVMTFHARRHMRLQDVHAPL